MSSSRIVLVVCTYVLWLGHHLVHVSPRPPRAGVKRARFRRNRVALYFALYYSLPCPALQCSAVRWALNLDRLQTPTWNLQLQVDLCTPVSDLPTSNNPSAPDQSVHKPPRRHHDNTPASRGDTFQSTSSSWQPTIPLPSAIYSGLHHGTGAPGLAVCTVPNFQRPLRSVPDPFVSRPLLGHHLPSLTHIIPAETS